MKKSFLVCLALSGLCVSLVACSPYDSLHEINNVDDFKSVFSLTGSNHLNVYEFKADIDLAGVSLSKPVFNQTSSGGAKLYPAEVRGNGHVIKNYTGRCPIFGEFGEGKIMDLTFDNCNVTGPKSALLLYKLIGGAWIQNITVNSNCTIGDGSETTVGGIVANVADSSVVSCTNNGTVKGLDEVGGIVGHSENSSFGDSVNHGVVSAMGNKVGGIVGYFKVGALTGSPHGGLTNLSNDGKISGLATNSEVGGIVGALQCVALGGSLNANDLLNSGEVSGGTDVGGVIGHLYSERYSPGTLDGPVNKGKVSGKTGVGGVVGCNDGICAVKNGVNEKEALVSGISKVGGVVGDGNDISFCTNHGTVNRVVSASLPEVVNLGGVCGTGRNLEGNKNDGTVVDLNEYGTKTLLGYNVGGICGGAWNGNIKSNEFSGKVVGNSRVGGICGAFSSQRYDQPQFINNVAKGNIEARGWVGGMVGYADAELIQHYNNNTVDGQIVTFTKQAAYYSGQEFGGMVGVIDGKNSGSVTFSGNTVNETVNHFIEYNPSEKPERYLLASLANPDYNTDKSNTGTITFVA